MKERRRNFELRRQNEALDMLEADSGTRDFYRDLVKLFSDKGLPYLVGGTFALQRYTGIARKTKDLDFFIRRADFETFRSTLKDAGYRAELTFPHWLGKAFKGSDFVDLAFRSANGEGEVDDEWFEHAVDDQLWGIPIQLCPPEETIWSKSFIMERERFDGADIIHIIRALGESLDWDRLVRRFGKFWKILLIHLISFGFVYPGERHLIPQRIMDELLSRLQNEPVETNERLCQGTLISREQYLQDIDDWGYIDARLEPRGKLNLADVEHWTAAIHK